MKKYITFILMVLSFPVLGGDYIGRYVTKPEIIPGFSKPYSEDIKKFIKSLTMKMVITKDSIILSKGDKNDTLHFKYEVDGKYLLVKNEEGEMVIYMPFYIENKNKIHGGGTIYFRE